MRAFLVIPRPPVQIGGSTLQSNAPLRIKLHWRGDHPASNYGLGVMLIGREIFDGAMFQHLREHVGAWIETDDPGAVAAALGIPETARIRLRAALSPRHSAPCACGEKD